MNYQLYKLSNNLIILDYGLSINRLSKVLYHHKSKILNNSHENKRIINYFHDDNNDLHNLKIHLIENINFKSLKDARQT